MKCYKQLISRIVLLIPVVALLVVACQKGETVPAAKTLQVYLTDDPIALDAVNIEILAVEAKIDTSVRQMDDHFGDDDHDGDDHDRPRDDFGSWTRLNAKTGVFNVLALRNGLDTLLASGSVTGTIRKIRITVGTNNTIVKDGVSYPLVLLNPTRNFLYIHVKREHHQDSANQTAVWIDFDLARSIIKFNGTYYLKPVLRPFCDRNFAGVEGVVKPKEAWAFVKVFNSEDTAMAVPNWDGRFRVRGLKAGTYSVLLDATANGYQDTLIQNVQLQAGKGVRLPEVILHQ
ncbi:MAG: DUF4382 domain-containing protein [Chitinophagaceae bacterium]